MVWSAKCQASIVVGYGFWLFLIGDIIVFAAFFATYSVLTDAVADGPSGRELFDLRIVALETACLLTSTFTCGLAGIGAHAGRKGLFYISMAITFVLGAIFVALELHEFANMIAEGAGPQRSAFLSAFFALIGCHGLHVTAGLLWLLTMMAQVAAKGFRDDSTGDDVATGARGYLIGYALATLLIVMLLVFGSLWIMNHLDHRSMPMHEMLKMQR